MRKNAFTFLAVATLAGVFLTNQNTVKAEDSTPSTQVQEDKGTPVTLHRNLRIVIDYKYGSDDGIHKKGDTFAPDSIIESFPQEAKALKFADGSYKLLSDYLPYPLYQQQVFPRVYGYSWSTPSVDQIGNTYRVHVTYYKWTKFPDSKTSSPTSQTTSPQKQESTPTQTAATATSQTSSSSQVTTSTTPAQEPDQNKDTASSTPTTTTKPVAKPVKTTTQKVVKKVVQKIKYVRLTRNALVYNQKGRAVRRRLRLTLLKRGKKVKALKVVKIKGVSYYQIGHNQFIKIVNTQKPKRRLIRSRRARINFRATIKARKNVKVRLYNNRGRFIKRYVLGRHVYRFNEKRRIHGKTYYKIAGKNQWVLATKLNIKH